MNEYSYSDILNILELNIELKKINNLGHLKRLMNIISKDNSKFNFCGKRNKIPVVNIYPVMNSSIETDRVEYVFQNGDKGNALIKNLYKVLEIN